MLRGRRRRRRRRRRKKNPLRIHSYFIRIQ
jgi:hypothetical protein